MSTIAHPKLSGKAGGSRRLSVVTPPRPIDLIRVRGSHRDVGLQLGEACGGIIRDSLENDIAPPAGRTPAEQLSLAARYREVTREAYPWLIEEHDAIAEAAGVDPIALFARGIEEIRYEPRPAKGRCSDLVAVPPATSDGHVLVGHTNDLYPQDEENIVAIEWTVRDEPVVLSIGVGPGLSAGFNSAGISFTGNELSPNDERIGIPRQMQFRAMLAQPTLEAAMEVALHPSRASSYNNILVARDAEAVNIEGSATDAEVTGPNARGVFAHTNHYACERMLPFEGDPEYAEQSGLRLSRGRELLDQAAGSITTSSMREMLADHENFPYSICRHHRSDIDDYSKTVFWCVCDVSEMLILFGRGNPCDSLEQEYRFA